MLSLGHYTALTRTPTNIQAVVPVIVEQPDRCDCEGVTSLSRHKEEACVDMLGGRALCTD
jgi:hypothetical protein